MENKEAIYVDLINKDGRWYPVDANGDLDMYDNGFSSKRDAFERYTEMGRFNNVNYYTRFL